MTKQRLPSPLERGDKAIIVSPSGNIDPVLIAGAKKMARSHRSDCRRSTSCRPSAWTVFAERFAERLSDMQDAMDDPEIKLIFCSRGGYGAVHLMDKLRFEAIKNTPQMACWV